ncbi:MAG: NAD(+)/NADH kinase [Clostridiales bacterium]|nr:NAD(+)/NADH kinase [Clostridiales bacterium]
MKQFYLIANPLKAEAQETAERMAGYLRRHGAECTCGLALNRRPEGGYTNPADIPADTEAVITLGGDGTLIQAARDLNELRLPMIGVNLGHLGYLTQVSKGEDVEDMLDALLEDRFTTETRMMLRGTVSGPHGVRSGIALNEIVLARRERLQVLRFEVLLNGEAFNSYMADGLIVATPTGSTAYNLSAGGPIVAPGTSLMILTPICSHSLNSRSVVVSADDRVCIRLSEGGGPDQVQNVVFDGDLEIELNPGDTLEIGRAANVTTLIQLKRGTFLETLRDKMARI